MARAAIEGGRLPAGWAPPIGLTFYSTSWLPGSYPIARRLATTPATTIDHHLAVGQDGEAGINTLIVSWWGWGDGDLDGAYDGYIEQHSHDALIRLLEHIKEQDLDFKVALMVEPWPDIVTPTQTHVPVPGTAGNLASDQKQMVLDYMWDNVYSVYPDLIFQWQDKALLTAVGELYFEPDEDSPDDRFTLRSFRLKEKDPDPGNAWTWEITKPLPYLQTVDNTAILSPRYDEWFLAAAHPNWWPAAWDRICAIRHDPYLKENLYDYQWQEAHNRRGEIDLVILWAWNSWTEQLYIEPDDGEGAAPAGDSLLRKTAWYTQRLRVGGAFQPFDSRQSELTAYLPRTVGCDPPGPMVGPTLKPDIELGVALHLWYGYDLIDGPRCAVSPVKRKPFCPASSRTP